MIAEMVWRAGGANTVLIRRILLIFINSLVFRLCKQVRVLQRRNEHRKRLNRRFWTFFKYSLCLYLKGILLLFRLTWHRLSWQIVKPSLFRSSSLFHALFDHWNVPFLSRSGIIGSSMSQNSGLLLIHVIKIVLFNLQRIRQGLWKLILCSGAHDANEQRILR